MITIRKNKINDEQDFINLESLWENLQTGSEMTVYQSFDWNKLLYEEWLNQKSDLLFSCIYIYVVYQDEEPLLLVPLLIQKVTTKTKWFGKKRGIYVLGYGSYSDYINFVYKTITVASVKFLIEQLREDFHGMDIYLTDIPEWTSTAFILHYLNIKVFNTEVSIAVKIENEVGDYNSKISKHTRQNLRTAINRMKKDGIEYEIAIFNDIHDLEFLEQLREIHIERLKEKNMNNSDLIHYISSKVRISIRKRKERRNNIIHKSMQREKLSQLVVVKLNSSVAGYLYGLRDGTTIRIMQNCFKSEYSFYSPLFRGAYDFILMQYDSYPKTDWIDFTRGNEEYKYKLGGVETKLYSFKV